MAFSSMKFHRKKREGGFTLIEIAMVIVIAGILLSLLSGSLFTLIKNQKIRTTQTRVKEINEAIRVFASINNRLPCAASLTTAPTAATYGRELGENTATTPATVDCAGVPNDAGATPSHRVSGGAGGRNVIIGMVPTRALNLPDEYGYDAWGSRLMYAVSVPLTSIENYNLNNSAVDIRDPAGNNLIADISLPGAAPFVVLSVGQDTLGGYNVNGMRPLACATTQADGENCDMDANFVNTLSTSMGTAVTRFDDYVSYYGSSLVADTEIPRGAVLPFNLDACPAGWQEVTEMAGRIIVGTGTVNINPPTKGVSGSADRTFAPRTSGGTHVAVGPKMTTGNEAYFENMPPYYTMIYCEKINIAGTGGSGSSGASGTGGWNFTFAPPPPATPTPPPPPPPAPPPPPPSGGKVMCSHFFRRGRLSRLMVLTCMEFAQANLSPVTQRGYLFWGIPAVKLMRIAPWTEIIMYWFVINRSEHVAYLMGRRDRPNYKGKLIRMIFEPMWYVTGLFIPEQNWKKLYSDRELSELEKSLT